jgi:hypothetical protein
VREVAERRGTVDEDRVVVVAHLSQRPAEPFRLSRLVVLQARRGGDQVHFEAPVRHEDVQRCMPGSEDVGGRRLVGGRVVAQHPGARALWVEVDHQHPVAGLGGGGGQPEGDRRLADTAFLVQQCSNTTHPGHRATSSARGDTRYLRGCRTLDRRAGRVASNVNSLGSGALP